MLDTMPELRDTQTQHCFASCVTLFTPLVLLFWPSGSLLDCITTLVAGVIIIRVTRSIARKCMHVLFCSLVSQQACSCLQ